MADTSGAPGTGAGAPQGPNNGRKPGLMRRLGQAVGYTILGVTPETWMSPMQPLRPMAESSKGRAFDFPVAWNINYIPRATEPLSFLRLKALMEYGVAPLVMQTRIDQMSALEWSIRPKEERKGKRAKSSQFDTQITQITKFLERPDRRLDWHQWLSAVLVQHFTYDGVVTYRHRTRGGQLYALENMDAACYSDDTEVLTKRGWFLFKDTKPDDWFATRNQKTKHFEWQQATKSYNFPHVGTMYHFHSRSVDLLVTPNHRMLVDRLPRHLGGNSHRERGEFIVRADELACGARTSAPAIPMTSFWTGIPVGEKVFDLPPLPDVARKQGRPPQAHYQQVEKRCLHCGQSFAVHAHREDSAKFCSSSCRGRYRSYVRMDGNDFCAFMGMWLAEGCTLKSGVGNVYISQQTKSKGFTAYKELLTRILGKEPRYSHGNFVISQRGLADYLRQFGQAPDKFVPDEIMEATPEQLTLFWHYYWLGDGHGDAAGHQGCTTVSRRLADQIVELIQKMGFSAMLRTQEARNDAVFLDRYADGTVVARPISCRECYRIYVRRSEKMQFKVSRQIYKGSVHCVSVPNEVLYVRRNGKPAWCGNTISVKIDQDGRPNPPPPSVAYQQVLKGMPTSNYSVSSDDGPQFTTGEMLYAIKNYRVDRAYGWPPGAQAINYIEMQLARAREQAAEFANGNAPKGIMTGPESMSSDQINAAQLYFDSIFAGNIEQRRRLWFMPYGSEYKPIDKAILFDQFDEWLARVICFAFSISPTPFIKQVNRATAGSQQEVALAEGLQPTMKFIKRMMDHFVQEDFNQPELEFAWIEDIEFDPTAKAVMNNTYGRMGAMALDDIREDLGLDKIGGVFSTPMYATPTGWVPVDPTEAAALRVPPTPPGGDPGSAGGTNPQNGGKNAQPGGNAPGSRTAAPAKGASNQPPDKTDNTEKSTTRSLYIKRDLLSALDLMQWAKAQGFEAVLDPSDMRVTQCYSSQPVDWSTVTRDAPTMVVAEGGRRTIEPLGDEGAIVLRFESDEMTARWHELMGQGVSHDYDTYKPHVTITFRGALAGSVAESAPKMVTVQTTTKDFLGRVVVKEEVVEVPGEIERPKTLEDIEPYTGPLLFGEEVWAPTKDNWQDDIQMLKLLGSEVDAAAAEAHPSPSPKQIAAGNYPKGHITVNGLDISIESAAGSVRRGVGADGKPWSVVMPTAYGYIRRVKKVETDV